jgi:hypothetical protein
VSCLPSDRHLHIYSSTVADYDLRDANGEHAHVRANAMAVDDAD